MARSRLTENQMRDEDVLTESEHSLIDHTTLSGSWVILTSNYTVTKGENVFVDTTTTSGWVVTLYDDPILGDTVSFIDCGNNCSINPVTVSGAGKKIMGLVENMDIDIDSASFGLVYSNTTFGWRVK